MMLTIDNLSKTIEKKQILREVCFSLDSGDVLGLSGPNGAGKTTLLKILGQMMKSDRGRLIFGDKDLATALPKTSVAYIPQDLVLYDDLTLQENLTAFGLGLCPDKTQLQGKIQELTSRLSLQDHLTDKISSLSGGMKRRANIACGLLGEPLLILMDEPVVGIDQGKTKDVELLLKYWQDKGAILVLSSHSPEFLRNCCNKLLILDKGSVSYFGAFDLSKLDHQTGESS